MSWWEKLQQRFLGKSETPAAGSPPAVTPARVPTGPPKRGPEPASSKGHRPRPRGRGRPVQTGRRPLPQAGTKIGAVVLGFQEGAVKLRLDSGQSACLSRKRITWDAVPVDVAKLFAVGQRIEVWVMSTPAVRGGDRVVVSYRELRPEAENPITQKRYPVGSRHVGTVQRAYDYGAFLRFDDGVEALLQREEIAWTGPRVNADKVFKVGDTVEVAVVRIDARKGWVIVSRRAVLPNPWETVATEYPAGRPVSGVVKNVTNYGVFVRLPNGLDGLVHVTQLPAGTLPESFRVGSQLDVVVLESSRERRRIALGLVAPVPPTAAG